jgi:hypothetical protein
MITLSLLRVAYATIENLDNHIARPQLATHKAIGSQGESSADGSCNGRSVRGQRPHDRSLLYDQLDSHPTSFIHLIAFNALGYPTYGNN